MSKCMRCGCETKYLRNNVCFACEQEDLEFKERMDEPPYEFGDKEAEFRHEKSIQGWGDDMDEEIWDKHFRFN